MSKPTRGETKKSKENVEYHKFPSSAFFWLVPPDAISNHMQQLAENICKKPHSARLFAEGHQQALPSRKVCPKTSGTQITKKIKKPHKSMT